MDPEIPNFRQKKRGMKLRAGMTLAVEPMINMGGFDLLICHRRDIYPWVSFFDNLNMSFIFFLRSVECAHYSVCNIYKILCLFYNKIYLTLIMPQKKRGMKLRAGMTLAVEPMINMGGGDVEWLDDSWTVVTEDV